MAKKQICAYCGFSIPLDEHYVVKEKEDCSGYEFYHKTCYYKKRCADLEKGIKESKTAVEKIKEVVAKHSTDSTGTTKKQYQYQSPSPSGIFLYQDKPYIKVIPSKRLFNSTMVHEVVTRGDFFAVCMLDHSLTILPTNTNLDKTTGKTK
jgi:hypothetical protein